MIWEDSALPFLEKYQKLYPDKNLKIPVFLVTLSALLEWQEQRQAKKLALTATDGSCDREEKLEFSRETNGSEGSPGNEDYDKTYSTFII